MRSQILFGPSIVITLAALGVDLSAVVLHSDGISSRFDLLNYLSVYEQLQKVAKRIMAEWSKEHDDATIIAVEDARSVKP